MKRTTILTLAITLVVLACFAVGCRTYRKHGAALESQASISKSQAEETALSKVPNGTIREAELEKEHGRLVWSFDVATPDTKNITEVQVDAKSGEVVSVETETPDDDDKDDNGDKEDRDDKDDDR